MEPAAATASPTPKPARRDRKGPGRRLPYARGDYELFDHIGRGGMADIYRAKKRGSFGVVREIVVKEVLPELSSSQRLLDLLVAEAKIAAKLEHPNIVRVEHLGRDEGTLYIAMEYVQGLDLRELLRRCAKKRVPLPVELSLRIVMDVLRALEHAHGFRFTGPDGHEHVGIVHRDVSPSNVLLALEGEVKLCDFGIARAHDEPGGAEGEAALGRWSEAMIEGKAGYMSPEQAHGEALDGRADVYAAGIILMELLSGKKLYKAKPGESLLEVARRAEIPALDVSDLPLGERIGSIVQKALAKRREERFATAGAMLAALESYAADAGLMASSVKLGRWLEQHFGPELLRAQRLRELATEALARGPLAVMVPVGSSSSAVKLDPREGDETPPTDHTLYEATGTHNAREALAAMAAMTTKSADAEEAPTRETPAPASSKRKKRKAGARTTEASTTAAIEREQLSDSGSRWALAEIPKLPMRSRAWLAWVAALMFFGAAVVVMMVR